MFNTIASRAGILHDSAALTTRDKLLDSAIQVFIEKGFTRASVDEICRRAGTTKGAFFHHFENKQEVGLLALDRFSRAVHGAFKEGADDVFEYLDRVVAIGERIEPVPVCLLGVLTLELAAANPAFATAANEAFARWIDDIEQLLIKANMVNSRELAEFFVSSLEGSLILARAREDRGQLRKNVTAFRNYLTQVAHLNA